MSELLHTIPGSFFYSRRGLSMKQVCAHASDKGFTNIIVLNESRKTPCSLVMSHLPAGWRAAALDDDRFPRRAVQGGAACGAQCSGAHVSLRAHAVF